MATRNLLHSVTHLAPDESESGPPQEYELLMQSNPNKCWKCGEATPDAHQLNSIEMRFARPPMPGDISICGGCGEFSVFDGLLRLEKPDPELMKRIMNTPELLDAQARIIARL
jgi:hypothetical protein